MFNLASKFLGSLLDPLIPALLLALLALLVWKRRGLALRFSIASFALLLLCSTKFVELLLVRSLEAQSQDLGVNVPQVQAIVVLGGAIEMPSGIHHSVGLIAPGDRLLAAFRLYRAGKAPIVLCSGGQNPIGATGTTPEAAGMASLLAEWDIPQSAIHIETGSINTRENAVRSYEMLAPLGIRRILLVTSAMHMPRAAGAFRKVGFQIIPAPADFRSGWGEPDFFSRWRPRAHYLIDAEEALHEWLGIGVYRLRGWM
jgi:uncharacterized SAM-binding protein YcdF (DUF218 family)